MKSHIDIEVKGKPLVLGDDFSLPIEERSPLFYDGEMFSLPVPIPLRGNRSFVQNIDTPQSDLRPIALEHEPARIIVEGMPFRSGQVSMTEDEEIKDMITLNIDAAQQSFDDLIGDLECQDVPLKDRIQIGEKIGNIKIDVKYEYRVHVTYRDGKKTDEDIVYSSTDQEMVTGIFEPQALGFSYPGICKVVSANTQVAQQKEPRSYPNNNTVKVPDVETSFINVTDAYPVKPYCNARIAYLHHGLNEDGTTSDDLPKMEDVTGANEDHYPYWVLDANRPQSGICFYVLYFLECLFKHLNVDYDLSALTAIEDFKRLAFFTTHCKYDTEVAHDGGGQGRYFFNATSNAAIQSKLYGRTVNWGTLSNEQFNQLLFGSINEWLDSRGCGGQLALNYPEPKQVQDFEYVVNGVKKRIVVGKHDVQSITIHATVTKATVGANILSMFANSDNFPEESVKAVLDSLQNSFGIRFDYDYEHRKVTAYLMRDVFRNNEEPIDFMGKVLEVNKVTEKITGVRMAYSAESDSKEQRKNIRKGIKDYDTDYDYVEYPEDRTVTDLTYQQIINLPKSQQKENLMVYVDLTTGNSYRWKTSKDALESGEYKISLFQVATFKGVEIGDCSPENEDFVREYVSDFIPVPFNDVNYRISELMVSGDTTKTFTKGGNTYTVSNFNSDYTPLLSAFLDVDMEHEFVEQYINNALPSAFADIYLTEQLKLVESYDPSSTDDGNSPLQEYDWGLSIAIMQGGGTNETVQHFDYNYDGFGNSRWRKVPGQYALTSDSLDMLGQQFDYNGDRSGDGGGERFALKIRAYQQPTWADAPLVNDDERDQQGNIIKKIRTRGLCDTFMSELFHFLLNRKKFHIPVKATAAELNDIRNHWKRRYRINGMVGWIGKINYDIKMTDGITDAELEFYSL